MKPTRSHFWNAGHCYRARPCSTFGKCLKCARRRFPRAVALHHFTHAARKATSIYSRAATFSFPACGTGKGMRPHISCDDQVRRKGAIFQFFSCLQGKGQHGFNYPISLSVQDERHTLFLHGVASDYFHMCKSDSLELLCHGRVLFLPRVEKGQGNFDYSRTWSHSIFWHVEK